MSNKHDSSQKKSFHIKVFRAYQENSISILSTWKLYAGQGNTLGGDTIIMPTTALERCNGFITYTAVKLEELRGTTNIWFCGAHGKSWQGQRGVISEGSQYWCNSTEELIQNVRIVEQKTMPYPEQTMGNEPQLPGQQQCTPAISHACHWRYAWNTQLPHPHSNSSSWNA